ncbi:glutamate ligase domain-containing protein, partial [Muriicola sp.]|uniref:glutamate ligase domain-containing protein n=1 Tax=Muriicola sp. TaxID=2020856 RepID=UPI0035686ECD
QRPQQHPPLDRLVKALETFKGVQRRFSYKIRQDDLIFIDDYAHHPTEIDAVLDAIREMHPGKKILAVFQPHLFSRTRDFMEDFANSLSGFDSILLLDIYPAREKPIPGITSQVLLEQIANPDKKLVSKQDLAQEIKARNPEILVTLGAGDIGLEADSLKREFEYEN